MVDVDGCLAAHVQLYLHLAIALSLSLFALRSSIEAVFMKERGGVSVSVSVYC